MLIRDSPKMFIRLIIKLSCFILLFTVVACNSKKEKLSPEDLVYHKIDGLHGAFPLPKSYVPVYKDELLNYTTQNNREAVLKFLESSADQPQAYFNQVFTPNGFVSVFPSKEIIPIKRAYSSYFVNLVETQAYDISSRVLSYDIVENKFLSFNSSKAFKLKIRSKHNHGEFLTTYYLITTRFESLIVIDNTKGKSDVKAAVATYILKNS